jgi:hypothetical protein
MTGQKRRTIPRSLPRGSSFGVATVFRIQPIAWEQWGLSEGVGKRWAAGQWGDGPPKLAAFVGQNSLDRLM